MRSLPPPLALALPVAAALVALSPRLLADVVMSPPKSCPPGQTGVTSHAGPKCVAVAPASCPVGWKGVLGGHCVLDVCDPGADRSACADGAECKPHDLCGEERLVTWGWGAAPAPPRGNELGAPPRHFDPPRHDFHYDDVCNAGKCAAGRTCWQTGVCLPRGAARAAGKPANGGEVRGYTPKNAKPSGAEDAGDGRFAKPPPSASAGAPVASTAPGASAAPTTAEVDAATPTEDVAPARGRSGPPRGGCTGCAGQPVGMLGGSTVVGLVLATLRKRRRPGRRDER